MNPQISLDLFIPPSPEFSYVNLLATNDRHGLNNGCFLIRVNAWAVKLLTATIAFHTFRPEVKLQYSEQSALEEMIEDVCLDASLCSYERKNLLTDAYSRTIGGALSVFHSIGSMPIPPPQRTREWSFHHTSSEKAVYKYILRATGMARDQKE